MRIRRGPILAVLAVLLASGPAIVPAALRAAAADPEGAELMRLTNLDRVALGAASLAIDPTLVALARDRDFTCPSSGATLHGRARDMAERDYFSHTILDCTKLDGTDLNALDVMLDFGYATMRGENIAWDDYPTSPSTYTPGCDVNGANCVGTRTSTEQTVAIAQSMFMQSPGHRSNILGAYDRFGCGHAADAKGGHYYACLFSRGGPTTTPAPTPEPTPAPTPTPAPSSDVARPVFVRFVGTSVVRAGYGRTVGTSVRDDVALARLTVTVDGRLLRSWAVAGRTATRSAVVPARWLTVGRHLVRWVARDRAGNTAIHRAWLSVRRS